MGVKHNGMQRKDKEQQKNEKRRKRRNRGNRKRRRRCRNMKKQKRRRWKETEKQEKETETKNDGTKIRTDRGGRYYTDAQEAGEANDLGWYTMGTVGEWCT